MFAALVALAYAILALIPLVGIAPAVRLGLLGLLPGLFAVRRVLVHGEVTARIIPAQAQTLLSFLLLSLGAGTGLLLVR